jgi:hypothetical protein
MKMVFLEQQRLCPGPVEGEWKRSSGVPVVQAHTRSSLNPI